MALRTLSEFFMYFWWWLGLPALMFGLLLTLGFQLKNRVAAVVNVLGLMGIGSFGLGMSFEGLLKGEMLSLSKSGTLMINGTGEPVSYWIALSVWLICSSMLFLGGIWLLFRIVKLARKRGFERQSTGR